MNETSPIMEKAHSFIRAMCLSRKTMACQMFSDKSEFISYLIAWKAFASFCSTPHYTRRKYLLVQSIKPFSEFNNSSSVLAFDGV